MSKIVSCEKTHFCSRELGAFEERERIIKLLEEEGSNIFALNYLVALIKEENK